MIEELGKKRGRVKQMRYTMLRARDRTLVIRPPLTGNIAQVLLHTLFSPLEQLT